MAGELPSECKNCTLKFKIDEFGVSELPASIKAKWAPFSRDVNAKDRRSRALKDASFRIYRAVRSAEQRSEDPLTRRQSKLAEMRSKAASAAAAAAAQLAASQSDSERSAFLAQRMLHNMQKAEQRRLEAQQAQRARLAAKKELIMTRLARAQSSDKTRHQHLLQQLHGRLAHADDVRRQYSQRQLKRARSPVKEINNSKSSGLTLVARRAVAEDWMEGLSPTTAASAAALRAAHSSRCLQRTWRKFAAQRKTTTMLARTFVALGFSDLDYMEDTADDTPADGINSAEGGVGSCEPRTSVPGVVMVGGLAPSRPSPHHMRFEDFAGKLQAPSTLKTTQALLRRLEQRLTIRGVTNDGAQALLRQLNPSAPAGRQLDRYPVRVMLCAYMIREHPEVVFNTVGDVEARLSAAAERLLTSFEMLLARLAQPTASQSPAGSEAAVALPGSASGSPPKSASSALPCLSPLTKSMTAYLKDKSSRAGQGSVARQLFTEVPAAESNSSLTSAAPRGSCSQSNLAQLLVAFDECWLEYLDQFVVWKGNDAAALERELMRMAVKLERSMRLKLGRRELGSPEVTGNPDLQAMINHVSHDHSLLAERIARLTGPEGSARLQVALEQVRQEVLAELEAEETAYAAEFAAEAGSDVTPRINLRRSRSTARSYSQGSNISTPTSNTTGQQNRTVSNQTVSSGESVDDQDAPVQPADGLENEQLVWEMLYNPAYSMPTSEAEAAWHRAMGAEMTADTDFDLSDAESMSPEQLTAAVAHRARIIAERAFWDSIVWRFKTAVQGQALPSQLAPLLAELGTELSGFVTDSMESQQLSEQYTERAVTERLKSRLGQQGGGANLTALGSMMEQLAQILLRSGSQDRAAEAANAVQQIQASMAAALTAAAAATEAVATVSRPSSPTGKNEVAPPAAALAEALAAALRLLMTHLKVVKLDAANARLAGLAQAMREQGAVRYLQTKLAAAWELSAQTKEDESSTMTSALIADKLKLTKAWTKQVQSGMVPQLQTALSAAGLLLDQQTAAAAAVAGGLHSIELRSGVRAAPGSAGKPTASGSSTPRSPSTGRIKPSFPVQLSSWQGVVRLGLLSLVIGDTPAVGPALPEVLMFDRVRLHELQNSLQQLLVTAAGLLIIQQLRQASGLSWDASARSQARRRLMVVLADPGMKLSHLVTELTQLAGADGVATEQRVKHMFTTIVDPATAAFKSIRSAITTCLAAHLLYGRSALAADGAASTSCQALLGRVGAAALADDVGDLGEKLAAVAAVNEAVHGNLLDTLVGDS